MSGLEILAVIGVAYVIGRFQQWRKNRGAIKAAEGLKYIVDALRDQGKGNKE